MTKIESEKVDIPNSAENIYNYLSNFKNFEMLMPAQVTNWEATPDDCSFTINGMATIGMKIIEKVPNSKIIVSSNGKVPFDFKMTIYLTEKVATASVGQITFESELNPMMKMMVEKPLGNFFNMLAKKMADIK